MDGYQGGLRLSLQGLTSHSKKPVQTLASATPSQEACMKEHVEKLIAANLLPLCGSSRQAEGMSEGTASGLPQVLLPLRERPLVP